MLQTLVRSTLYIYSYVALTSVLQNNLYMFYLQLVRSLFDRAGS